jgi:hypothetical protein
VKEPGVLIVMGVLLPSVAALVLVSTYVSSNYSDMVRFIDAWYFLMQMSSPHSIALTFCVIHL